jgi:hypothetical protein
MMKPREIFKLIVRLVGLMFLYKGLSDVPLAISALCPRFPHIAWGNFIPALIMIGWPVLVAYWLIIGAPPLTRWAYPDDKGAD